MATGKTKSGGEGEFVLPHRRFTFWAFVYLMAFVAIPLTLVLGGLDSVLWWLSIKVLGLSCYGLGCIL